MISNDHVTEKMAAPVKENFQEIYSSFTNDLCSQINGLKLQQQDSFLHKCKESCSKLLALTDPNRSDEEKLNLWLPVYTQISLDVALCIKNSLVDDDFPEETCRTYIDQISELLERPSRCLKALKPKVKLSDVIGAELSEIIHWSNGELMYMYCYTLVENVDRMQRNKSNFLQCCFVGVKSFDDMLNIRGPIAGNTAGNSDQDTVTLLEQGLYSDSHVLAQMYGAELCFWFLKFGTPGERCHHLSFKAKDRGIHFLSTFIKCVKGPLNGAGWDCSKAQAMMSEINKL